MASEGLDDWKLLLSGLHCHPKGVRVRLASEGLDELPEFTREDRLVGLVVKVSASRAEGPGFKSTFRQDFFGVESYQ